MSILKTLGGDRLGSGNKMKVAMHGYERSNHDLGYIFRTTMATGTLVPFMKLLVKAGDTIDINLDGYVNTLPTIGPVFGSWKLQLDVFEAPIRLYQGMLHNNKIGIGMHMEKIKFPRITQITTERPDPNVFPLDLRFKDIDNCQANPSSIFAYLGMRGFGFHEAGNPEYIRSMNAVPFLAYWEIYKNYYSNKMEEVGAVIHRPMKTVNFIINAITLYNSGVGTALPVYPGVATIPMGAGTSIHIAFPSAPDAAAFDPALILIGSDSDGEKPANQWFLNWQRISATEWISTDFNIAEIRPYQDAKQWKYLPADQVTQDEEPEVHFFPLENIDTMREQIIAWPAANGYNPFYVNDVNIEPYKLVLNRQGAGPAYYYPRLSSQEGLAIKTYQSDMLNNWLNTEWIDGVDGITAITAIDTSGGNFTLDTLNLSKKVYDMLNRIAVSGGTYKDWQEVQFDHQMFTGIESPVYHGGLIKEVVFQEVISQASAPTGDGQEPLGSLAGKGTLTQKHKGGNITVRVNEAGYLIGIVSLTPRLDYSQGNDFDIDLDNMSDIHVPALDQIGFQELLTQKMAWWDQSYNADGTVNQWSAGKQPAWLDYMSNVNKVRGNFAIPNNQMFMVLNRNYEYDPFSVTSKIKDLTTYIDPAKFNHVFAQTRRDAQNFWVQLGVDIHGRRKMSAKLMPNL